ncbi:PEP-CTERM sorting domain-containing protein [Pirellulales bacterium]|nr:PEP-CTERM sorting domain-containing protein [Pirellulales bacterium]
MLHKITYAPLFVALAVAGSTLHAAMISDFTTWTEVEDPAHSGMSSSVDSASQITLNASGSIPTATDIGYSSVDGDEVASSSSGHYFSFSEDFHVAIDFSISSANSVGLGAIGFGIGEDAAGANSAGVGLGIFNGSPLLFAGAARTNDVNTVGAETYAGASSGRLFVAYEAASGTVTWGVNTTPGAAAPTDTGTFANVQDGWTDSNLLVSFFLRSDTVLTFPPLQAGELTSVFSNFEVLDGTPIGVPEPTAAALLSLGVVFLGGRRRRHLA